MIGNKDVGVKLASLSSARTILQIQKNINSHHMAPPRLHALQLSNKPAGLELKHQKGLSPLHWI